MPDIPAPQPIVEDIYSYGFDKSLNRALDEKSTQLVAGSINAGISTSQILKGDLALTTLSIANQGVIVSGDTSKGLQIGNVRSGAQFLAPFDVANDGKGTIRRIGRIQLASETDLSVSSIEPASGTKAVWANINDVRIQPGTTGAVRLLRAGLKYSDINHQKLAITNSSANTIYQVSLATTTFSGGTLGWTVTATDGTDYQCTSGVTSWAAVNKGGVYTTNITDSISSTAASAGTLTGAWSITTGTNLINLRFTPTSSLATTDVSLYINSNQVNMRDMARV